MAPYIHILAHSLGALPGRRLTGCTCLCDCYCAACSVITRSSHQHAARKMAGGREWNPTINWKWYSELPWCISISNYHTENSIASDKRWITCRFHQQVVQLVDLILPQAIIGSLYRTGQPHPHPHPTAKNTFGEMLCKERKKLKRLSADPLTSPMLSGILKLKGQSDRLVWPSHCRH